MKIWVDDIRTPPDDTWVWFKNSSTTIRALNILRLVDAKSARPNLMSLDHDLGGEDTSRAIVLWMCENDFWPVEVRVHSQNPIGVSWLQGMIDRYHPSNAHKYNR